VWFGLGLSSKIVLGILLTFFPLMVNTAAALASVERERIELMRSLKATGWKTFRPVTRKFSQSASALSRAEVISRPPILNLSADRSRSRSTSIYDSPSTAHLTGLQAPAMRSVHPSLDHIAIAVVSI